VQDPRVRCAKNNNFQSSLLFIIEMVISHIFGQKKGHDPLEVRKYKTKERGTLIPCTKKNISYKTIM